MRVASLVALCGTALLANVLGVVLLRSAAPYLSPLDLLPFPLTGAAYAIVAGYAAWDSRRPANVLVLVLVSIGLAAPVLSTGLAQRSWLWVAIASLEVLMVPAIGWICLATLRGDEAGVGARRLLMASFSIAALAGVIRVVTFDPAAFGWCRCVGNPLGVGVDPDTYLTLEPWLTAAHVATVALTLVAVALGAVGRPGRSGWPEILLVAGLLAAAGAWVAADVATLAGRPLAHAAPVVAVGLVVVLAVHAAWLLRQRPSRAHVADLLLAARERSDPARLRELVARAVGDPSAAVYWWDPDARTFVDHRGRAADSVARATPETHVLEVESETRPIARVVTDRALVRDPGILEPVAEALRLSRENERLQAELAESLLQVRESRSRIVQASDETRRRIERDLHDGAQQLLISTGAKLNLASTRVDATRDAELAETLADASDELGRALEELRALARGITPTALVHGSLPDALEDLALRCPVPTTLHVEGTGHAQLEVAATAYFVVAECLANVVKHAQASAVRVRVTLGDPLRLAVCDDGVGGADPAAGSGLGGLVDRVAAQGGSFDLVTSTAGTTVSVSLPNGPT